MSKLLFNIKQKYKENAIAKISMTNINEMKILVTFVVRVR